MNKLPKADLSSLLPKLPAIVSRREVPNLLGGMISRGFLQNLDSAGTGPRRLKIGKRVGYLREDLVEWLESRATIFEPSNKS